MAEKASIQVRCHCRAHVHTFSVAKSSLPLKAFFCHCWTCRHVTGAPATPYISIPLDQPGNDPDLSSLKEYNTSAIRTRYFCGTCGTHLYEKSDDGEIGVTSGVIDQAAGVTQIVGHEFLSDTKDGGSAPWLTKIGDRRMEMWTNWPQKSETAAPFPWKSTIEGDGVPTSLDDKLVAQCHCKSICIVVSRPGENSRAAKAPYPDLIVPTYTGQDQSNPENTPWWLPRHGKYLAGLCACESCRLSFGFEPISWLFVPVADIASKDGRPFERYFDGVKAYRSSSDATRVFCDTCGATVFWDGDERPMLIDLALGLLEAPSGVRAEEWLAWRTTRVSYKEDALDKELIDAIENGLQEWGKERGGDPKGA